jgi:ferredoxin/flavodoxin---NADP+ reductase
LFAHLGAAPLDPASDRVMICGSTAMLTDAKTLALAHGFVEGSSHEPGSFVVERAFVDR